MLGPVSVRLNHSAGGIFRHDKHGGFEGPTSTGFGALGNVESENRARFRKCARILIESEVRSGSASAPVDLRVRDTGESAAGRIENTVEALERNGADPVLPRQSLDIQYAESDFFCDDRCCSLCWPADESAERLGHYRCQCCGEVDPQLFMIRDHIWLAVTDNRPHLLLCRRCTEAALGRSILPEDLTDCPLNCEQFPDMMLKAGHGLAKVALGCLGFWSAVYTA